MAGLSGVLGEAITFIKKVTSKDTQKPNGQEEVKQVNETETDIYDEDLKEEREENMSRFYRYGRWWYTSENEAQDARRYNERVYFDKGMRAYYIIRPKKSFWEF